MAKKKDDAADAAEQQEAVATVHMVRDVPQHPGGPVEADVHPDEVAAFTAADWRVAEDKGTEA